MAYILEQLELALWGFVQHLIFRLALEPVLDDGRRSQQMKQKYAGAQDEWEFADRRGGDACMLIKVNLGRSVMQLPWVLYGCWERRAEVVIGNAASRDELKAVDHRNDMSHFLHLACYANAAPRLAVFQWLAETHLPYCVLLQLSQGGY